MNIPELCLRFIATGIKADTTKFTATTTSSLKQNQKSPKHFRVLVLTENDAFLKKNSRKLSHVGNIHELNTQKLKF